MRIATATIFLICLVALGVVCADDNAEHGRSDNSAAKTIVYAARNAPANLLGETLAGFLEESGGRVVADPVSNVLLIQTASQEDQERVLAVLQQLDRAPRTIRVQLHLVQSRGEALAEIDVASLSGATEKVLGSIRAIESKGRAYVANRMELTAIENQPSMLQVGEDVPLVRGTVSVPGRGSSNSYQSVPVGTLFKVHARLSGESDIVMEVDFEKSEVSSLAGNSDEDRQSSPSSVTKLTHQATSRLHDGHSLLVATIVSHSKEGFSEAYLVLSASIDAAHATKQAVTFRASSKKPDPVTGGKSTSDFSTADRSNARFLDYYGKLIAKYDQNDDKALDAEERSSMSKDPAEADTNKDGLVNVEELMTWSMKR